MHVASLMVLDPSTIPDGFSMQNVRDFYESRLHLAAPFRRRLVEIPLGHPPPAVDRGPRLRPRLAPAPHRRTAARRSARAGCTSPPTSSRCHLDRTRPLWECWIIDGLEDGHVAVLTKVHHAAIDGVSGDEITVAMLQLDPEDEPPPPTEEWKPDRVPTDTELLGVRRLVARASAAGDSPRPRGAQPSRRYESENATGVRRRPAARSVQRAAHVVQRRAHTPS